MNDYIEPTEEDVQQGRKIPTRAHHAIAEMAREGMVRVVITTNFDRLLEQALRERGTEPIVVDSVHAIQGAEPLGHAKCYLVKLHGDYKDGLVHILERVLVEAVSSKTVVGALHEGILHAIPRRNDMQHSSPTGTQNNISLLVISVPLSHTTISGNNRRSALAVLPSSQSVPLFYCTTSDRLAWWPHTFSPTRTADIPRIVRQFLCSAVLWHKGTMLNVTLSVILEQSEPLGHAHRR